MADLFAVTYESSATLEADFDTSSDLEELVRGSEYAAGEGWRWDCVYFEHRDGGWVQLDVSGIIRALDEKERASIVQRRAEAERPAWAAMIEGPNAVMVEWTRCPSPGEAALAVEEIDPRLCPSVVKVDDHA